MFCVHWGCKVLIFGFLKVVQRHNSGVAGKLVSVLLEN
jgi:hypothetical protein